ncbi:MAG: hypothetical protein ABS944_16395 [Solibacillus sp.]|uniref:hypothetical protein n=1 Tax=Solibacillus sp. TaxID=1909654 RepID=UPI003315B732
MNLDGNFPTYEKQELIKTGVDAIKSAVDAGTIGKTPRRQVFTANGTWTAPAGVTKIFVTGGGAGGGGGYVGNESVAGTGGITSFGSLFSLTGGGGGTGSSNILNGQAGVAGGSGGQSGGYLVHNATTGLQTLGNGGSVALFKGGSSSTDGTISRKNYKNGGYCCGGGAAGLNGGAGAGGSGDFVVNYPLTVSPGTSYPIVIGLGGAGVSASTSSAGDGGNGILIVEWWE